MFTHFLVLPLCRSLSVQNKYKHTRNESAIFHRTDQCEKNGTVKFCCQLYRQLFLLLSFTRRRAEVFYLSSWWRSLLRAFVPPNLPVTETCRLRHQISYALLLIEPEEKYEYRNRVRAYAWTSGGGIFDHEWQAMDVTYSSDRKHVIRHITNIRHSRRINMSVMVRSKCFTWQDTYLAQMQVPVQNWMSIFFSFCTDQKSIVTCASAARLITSTKGLVF